MAAAARAAERARAAVARARARAMGAVLLRESNMAARARASHNVDL